MNREQVADFLMAAIPWAMGIGIFLLLVLVFGMHIQDLYSKGCAIKPSGEKLPAERGEKV